jgi:hypothetical protein
VTLPIVFYFARATMAGTRFCTAVVGALLMFLLGSNLTMIGEYTGLVPQRILRWFGASLRVPSGRKAKVDPAAELLKRVLHDDRRELCKTRYPNGLTVTQEQASFLDSQRYFVVLTLRNNEEMLHHTLYELLHTIARLGPSNVFVSVFENNSKDKTPQFLAFFTDMLKLAGVQHHLVSSLTWAAEVEAAQAAARQAAAAAKKPEGVATPVVPAAPAAAAAASKGRRLLEDEGAGGASLRNADGRAMPERRRSSSISKGAVDVDVDAGVDADAELEENGEEATRRWWGDGDFEEARLLRQHGMTEDEMDLVLEALRVAHEAGAGSEEAGDRPSPRTRNGSSSFPSSSFPSDPFPVHSSHAHSAALGRILAESPAAAAAAAGASTADAAGDILSFDAKWKGNRIEFLARVRNWAMRPLFGQRRTYHRLILMNDAYVCAEDITRLALHRDADVACGLDFDTTPHYSIGFYDTWVDRDVHGASSEGQTRRRTRRGRF